MDQVFYDDYYRMTGHQFNRIEGMVRCIYSHQIRFMKLWRKAKRAKHSLIYKARLKRYALKYGLEISLDAQIGNGLYLGHPYNIAVAGGAILGKNVNLHKGCTIGRENRGKRKGVPTIGDQVFVGINATVIGNIHIGNDVMIAPNSFVNFDVPDHSIVIGNPGKIIPKEYATAQYVGYCV